MHLLNLWGTLVVVIDMQTRQEELNIVRMTQMPRLHAISQLNRLQVHIQYQAHDLRLTME